MSMGLRALLAVGLTLAVVWAAGQYKNHLVAKGDALGAARVQGQWDKVRAQQAEQLARDEQAARLEEARTNRNAERIASEQAQRASALQARAVRADTRLRGLLDTIYGLDAADADLPRPGAHASPAAVIGAAATARQLLGQCASRYRTVAGEADQLREQVIGLQAYAKEVCQGRAAHDD